MRVVGCCRRRRCWNEEAVRIVTMLHSRWWRTRQAISQARSERPIERALKSIEYIGTHTNISQKILHGYEMDKLGGRVGLVIWSVLLGFAAAAEICCFWSRPRERQGTTMILRGLYVAKRCGSRRWERHGMNKIPGTRVGGSAIRMYMKDGVGW
jgi:hypothetical protein